jgi:hypothetical protein
MEELIDLYIPILFNLILVTASCYAIKNKHYIIFTLFLIGLIGYNLNNIIKFFENL